jgi:hypothetical protein
MTRFVPVTVLVMLLAGSRVASATDTLNDGSTIAFTRLQLHENNSPTLVDPKVTPDSLWHYFNLAHCQCATPTVAHDPGYHETTFAYYIGLMGGSGTPIGHPLQIWMGSECTNDTTRAMNCHTIDSAGLTSIDTLRGKNDFHPELPLFDFMNPQGATECAPAAARASTFWAAVDTDGSGQPDYFAPQQITTDTLAPELPSNLVAQPAESAINLSWKAPADTTDIYAYQVLCARIDDTPVKTSGPDPLYFTAQQLCGANIPFPLTTTELPASSIDPATDMAVTLSDEFKNVDKKFLCAEDRSATSTGIRITGLENGMPYKVALLVMDKFGNAKGTYFTSTVTPAAVTDLWEDLHDKGSTVEGGLCLLAETYGDDSSLTGMLRGFRDDTLGGSGLGRALTRGYYATLGRLGGLVHGSLVRRAIAAVVLAPAVVAALLWYWLTLPGVLGLAAAIWLWRRRRALAVRWAARRSTQVAAAGAICLLGAGRAHADGYQPYWENTDPTVSENQAPADDVVTWHAGIRVGPYIPDIDKQLGKSPGPYEQMFGGYRVLPMLDVDRMLWSGFGQVGVGISVGYMQKTARAFKMSSDPNATDRVRASDDNKFRLIPMALTATYRFTWLDDNYGIPLVPYARGGLSYYLWWINAPGGDLAKVCKGGGMEPDCSQNKALGGSLGLQGSIGLSIRAERIDASTANSMRQSGIMHAGIYGELSLAKVDGFGSDKKLSVGDRTWFAGVDFEF